jgi:hypothetical protein
VTKSVDVKLLLKYSACRYGVKVRAHFVAFGNIVSHDPVLLQHKKLHLISGHRRERISEVMIKAGNANCRFPHLDKLLQEVTVAAEEPVDKSDSHLKKY